MPNPEGGAPPQEQNNSMEFKQGDRVRLTEAKIQALKDGGFLEGFASVEGTVSVAYGGAMSVDFGGSVRQVKIEDVERITD